MSRGHHVMTPCIGSGSCKKSIPSRYTQKSVDVFNSTPLAILHATMRHFRLLPLDILVTWECEIENVFPHLSTWWSKEQLWSAWNIKLLAKTWNPPKFPTRVTSMVYCSMRSPQFKPFQETFPSVLLHKPCIDFKFFLQKILVALAFIRCESWDFDGFSPPRWKQAIKNSRLEQRSRKNCMKNCASENLCAEERKFVVSFFCTNRAPISTVLDLAFMCCDFSMGFLHHVESKRSKTFVRNRDPRKTSWKLHEKLCFGKPLCRRTEICSMSLYHLPYIYHLWDPLCKHHHLEASEFLSHPSCHSSSYI
jgi:hypothetical protein